MTAGVRECFALAFGVDFVDQAVRGRACVDRAVGAYEQGVQDELGRVEEQAGLAFGVDRVEPTGIAGTGVEAAVGGVGQ